MAPTSKYSALLDPRRCFDSLRRSSLMSGGAEQRVNVAQQLSGALDRRGGGNGIVGARAASLLHVIEDPYVIPSAPLDFESRACEAYVQTIQSDCYWFSCDEVCFWPSDPGRMWWLVHIGVTMLTSLGIL